MNSHSTGGGVSESAAAAVVRFDEADLEQRSGVIVERAGPLRYSLPCYHIARYRGPHP